MNKVLSIPLIVFSSIITFVGNAEASRCRGITITYSLPESFVFTYEDFNDTSKILYTLRPSSVIGQCKKSDSDKYPNQYLYIVQQARKPSSDCGANKENYSVQDSTSLLQYDVSSCSGMIALSMDNGSNAASVTPSNWSESNEITNSAGMGVRLVKPLKPGVTTVDPSFMLSGNYYSMLGVYAKSAEKENISIIMPKELKLIYKATCRASVNDVDFGEQHVEDIMMGKIEQLIKIDINCHETLPSYTISVTPDNGIEDSSIGTIKTADNPTVGYQLSWGDDKVAKNSSAVSFGQTIIPRKRPDSPDFTIPIRVAPKLFTNNMDKINAGNATASITIQLTYN